jgi:hypothetical protein
VYWAPVARALCTCPLQPTAHCPGHLVTYTHTHSLSLSLSLSG